MERAAANAAKVAQFLFEHPEVACVHYPSLLPADDPVRQLMERQSSSAGSTFSFEVKGGQAEAFAFLNKFEVFKLAVSLGGTESLICHPATTVYSGLTEEARPAIGITPALIRYRSAPSTLMILSPIWHVPLQGESTEALGRPSLSARAPRISRS
jgi:methionine-gamma-lyase